jgi:hypothetical protein
MAKWIDNLRSKRKREEKLEREMSHLGSGYTPTQQGIDTAIEVGMGRMGRDVAYGEKPLAGGLDIAEVGGIPINATDFLGTGIPSKLAMGAKMFAAPMLAALGGTAIASKASQGAKLNALANLMRKERGIFAGVNAKTADMAKLEEAKRLQAQGVPDADIWGQTGWALDTPDKMPRFEIPDDAAKQIKNAKKTGMIDPYQEYKRLAGEAEARLTQSRMNLTPEQRLAQYPYDPEYFEQATGVPLNSLIVRKGGDGTAMSVKTLDSLNPTGSIFSGYDPSSRATAKLAENIKTLAHTSGKNPDEMITIYRGAPSSQTEINAGDFVTTDLQLAKDYAGAGRVISQKVRAGDILDDVSDPLGGEYIYRPSRDANNG